MKKKRILLSRIVSQKGIRLYPEQAIEKLAQTIQSIGLQTPLCGVKKNKKAKRVVLLDGLLRLKAYKMANNMRSPSRRRKTIDMYVTTENRISTRPTLATA